MKHITEPVLNFDNNSLTARHSYVSVETPMRQMTTLIGAMLISPSFHYSNEQWLDAEYQVVRSELIQA